MRLTYVVVYLMFLPLTTQYQLCVCGDTSWWRGQALKLGHSYTNLPFTNTDEAQQFSTGWEYGSVTGVGESESGSSAVEVSTCWLNFISNKKSAPCSTGYSATLQQDLQFICTYSYVLYRGNASCGDCT